MRGHRGKLRLLEDVRRLHPRVVGERHDRLAALARRQAESQREAERFEASEAATPDATIRRQLEALGYVE